MALNQRCSWAILLENIKLLNPWRSRHYETINIQPLGNRKPCPIIRPSRILPCSGDMRQNFYRNMTCSHGGIFQVENPTRKPWHVIPGLLSAGKSSFRSGSGAVLPGLCARLDGGNGSGNSLEGKPGNPLDVWTRDRADTKRLVGPGKSVFTFGISGPESFVGNEFGSHDQTVGKRLGIADSFYKPLFLKNHQGIQY